MGSHRVNHDRTFREWHKLDRSFRLAAEKLGVPQRTLRSWSYAECWHERADLLDARAQRISDKAAVKRAVARLAAAAERGRRLCG